MNKRKIGKQLKILRKLEKTSEIELQKIEKEQLRIFSNIKDVQDILTKYYERDYSIGMQHVDILIGISQNLVSFSITIFIAFIGIPSLNGNLLPPLIAVLFSSFVLACLIIYREEKMKKLNLPYLESFLSSMKHYLNRLNTELTKIEKESNDLVKELENGMKEVEKYK